MSKPRKLGDKVTFRDWRPNGEVVIRTGIVNGEPFEHGPNTIIPVYVPDGDRIVYVNSANELEDLNEAPQAP